MCFVRAKAGVGESVGMNGGLIFLEGPLIYPRSKVTNREGQICTDDRVSGDKETMWTETKRMEREQQRRKVGIRFTQRGIPP